MDGYLKGTFKRIIYQSDDGYTVGLFKIKESSFADYNNKTVTITGYLLNVNEEDNLYLEGSFIYHKKYGEQFAFTSFEKLLPEEKEGIIDFLSSSIFKGVGESTAKKIVAELGDNALNIIINDKDALLRVKGISKKNANSIYETLLFYNDSYKDIVVLNNMGFSNKESIKIYNKYKEKTADIIENNIYILVKDFNDISFNKIDKIFLSKGGRKDDERRLSAAILYVVQYVCTMEGHTYLEYSDISNYMNRLLGGTYASSELDSALNNVIDSGDLVLDNDKYYLSKMYEAETSIAARLKYLSHQKVDIYKDIDKYIKEYEEKYDIKYNIEQIASIKNAISLSVSVITGGPGTGKTTIIKGICEVYKKIHDINQDKFNEEVFLLAPTGRASKRISFGTNLNSSTIHRFLKWNKELDIFQINEFNKSSAKMVIIDESSMMDTYLLDSLLKGLSVNCKIVFVGDADQLPSVSPGDVLKDIINSGIVKVTRLTELFRQSKGSNIINLAYYSNMGIFKEELFNLGTDVRFIECNPSMVKSNIIDLCSSLEYQVLAPMYKTYNGIDNLNSLLEEIINPKSNDKLEILINGVYYRINDKVICLNNFPDEGIFNGDIGYIYDINNKDKEIIINFDNNYVKFTSSNFNKFKHAYAISIHKSQGSEFDNVIIPVLKEYNKMLYRKLIYTGITRAKKNLILVGELDAFKYAISNNLEDERKTTLCYFLKK